MHRVLIGLAISVLGTICGFSLAHGDPKELLVFPEILVVLSFIVGGLSMTHGISDVLEIIRGALELDLDLTPARLKTNLRICEAGSRFAFCGGIVSAILGIIVTMGSLGGDVSQVGTHIAHASTGIFWAVVIVGIFFQPLKFKFLHLLHETAEQERNANSRQDHEQDVP